MLPETASIREALGCRPNRPRILQVIRCSAFDLNGAWLCQAPAQQRIFQEPVFWKAPVEGPLTVPLRTFCVRKSKSPLTSCHLLAVTRVTKVAASNFSTIEFTELYSCEKAGLRLSA